MLSICICWWVLGSEPPDQCYRDCECFVVAVVVVVAAVSVAAATATATATASASAIAVAVAVAVTVAAVAAVGCWRLSYDWDPRRPLQMSSLVASKGH